ncbi:MAG: TIGR02710 family CRISPR-associated CARF protein [Geminicoccaceae bacterium]|nr:TIGR02710 family CRISPR-associated CARF protein [Geminicoccaceae bacterium]MCS7269310.1 TIGR02710 family CRISPR-associated CARF protein [Geminicoccaceae bacterium]MDW8126131.1 TIGR02710 family CRISPR-associated CARF protein [Geminicoccaceae bacterium]
MSEAVAKKPKTVLVCTVGGSPEPIVKAIEARRPDRVVFLVTAREGALAGSEVWVAGPVPPEEAARVRDPRTIPERSGLGPDAWEYLVVPVDDPDTVFWRARELLRDLRRRFPAAEIVADYTGGSKSMTAGLMLAAVADPQPVAIQFIGGARPDLVRVVSGTERPLSIAVDAILAERALADAERAFGRFAYDEAVALLSPWAEAEPARRPLPPALLARLDRAHRLARAFAAWDRFAHGEASALLEPLADLPAVAALLPPLAALSRNAGRTEIVEGRTRWLPPEDPLLPLDIWHNACRRAAQGRFDDAIARAYRVVEATVQWILWSEKKIDTYRVSREQLSPELFEHLDRRKTGQPLKVGLEQGLDILRYELRDHWLTGVFGVKDLTSKKSSATDAYDRLVRWKERRNQSILNHGFEPLSEADWCEVAAWMAEVLVPPLERAVSAEGMALRQLPTSLSGLTGGL